MKPNRLILGVVLGIAIFTLMLWQSAAARPPEKPGNPGVPGLLAEIAELNAQIAELNAQIEEMEAIIQEYEGFAPVPKTGQTTSYGPGDDGELQKGVPWPDPRFTDNSDGTVTDNLTGLIWLKNANCFGRRIWDEALDDCNNLAHGICDLEDGSVAGDWRLPNINELLSLHDYSVNAPSLPVGHPFTNMQVGWYWSSTMSGGGGTVWSLYFGGIMATIPPTETSLLYVWCVRDRN